MFDANSLNRTQAKIIHAENEGFEVKLAQRNTVSLLTAIIDSFRTTAQRFWQVAPRFFPLLSPPDALGPGRRTTVRHCANSASVSSASSPADTTAGCVDR
jgi:hypothetical protein